MANIYHMKAIINIKILLKHIVILLNSLVIFIVISNLFSIELLYSQQNFPLVYTLDPSAITEIQRSISKGNKEFDNAFKKLRKDADKALGLKPVSVVEKDQIPPSGDKHDYMSLSRYWWPDPNKTDGLPYIRRDGETNPEVEKIPDHTNLNKLVNAVTTLSLAYYYTANEKYAEHAVKFLRVWFLNPETKMNPNLNYAQAVLGRSEGRGSGIIDSRGFIHIIDAVGLLSLSKIWTAENQINLKQWFGEYLTWLLESKNGIDESNAKNNHGTWYDAQVSAIAMFVGKSNLAKEIIENSKTKRIAAQLQPDGSQPEELARTRSLHYCFFNLDAMFILASLGEKVNINLWNYQTEDGRSIKKSLDWLLPFLLGEKDWKYEQIDDFRPEKIYHLLLQAANKFKDRKYLDASTKLIGVDVKTNRANLLYMMIN